MPTAATLRIPFIVALAGIFSLIGSQSALALSEPTVPEPVATYIATGLVPRLADLYGPSKNPGSGIDFGTSTTTTTTVGEVHRVFAWTADFLAGKATGNPMELTNNWVVPVAVKKREVGLATIWINPVSDNPELASFDLGPGLVTALAAAPKGDVLVRDDLHSAWFATDGKRLVPLVSGSSGVATTTTISSYQGSLPRVTPAMPIATAATNDGLLIAGVVLIIVVILLAIFVLLPDRRRKGAVADFAAALSDPIPVAQASVIRTRSAQGAAKAGPVTPAPAKPAAPAAPRKPKPSAPRTPK